MKYKCSLYVVNDIDISRNFYENLLNQKVLYDFGENITYKSGFSIQDKKHFSNMIEIDEESIIVSSNNGELYFETDTLDEFLVKLKSDYCNIELIHDVKKHSWGQRVIRFYDPDKHIIEVGESMESVIIRFFNEGYSIEDIVKISQHPEDFVREVIKLK